MFTNRLFYLLIVVFLMVTGCAPQVAPTLVPTSAPLATLTQDEPVILRLAVADAENRPSDPYVREFIEQVKMLSEGNITIEPIWEAGNETEAGFEVGVIQLVKEGQTDLGLAGSRAFDLENITSFQALQAPFLITNDALAEAVAGSEVATRMLDSLSSVGVVGLTLWPEDLRHPFSVVPDKQILSPEDFAGLNVRATPSKLTYTLLDTFGASPMMADSDYQAAESGLRQGFSLTGTPTATGNVVFFPKFQVLFANGAAFEKLSERQQSILREAAIATQKKAIAEHLREVEAATAWCSDGGTIVLASDEQVAAFESAAQPVFTLLETDPLNTELIAAIRELKANTEPSAGAEACGPAPLAPFDHGNIPPELIGTWSFDAFGESWTVDLTAEGAFSLYAPDGKLDVGGSYGIFGSEAVFRDEIRGTGTLCSPAEGRYHWELAESRLMLTVIEDKCTIGRIEQWTAGWQKVEEEWSTGLPPEGVWQVEISTDDFVRMGVMQSKAKEWAGTYTWTLQDGNYILLWEDGSGKSGKCVGTYGIVADFVRLTSTTNDCEGEVEDFQWRLDDDGLHIHLIAAKNIGLTEIKANFEAKPWQKMADQ